MTEITNWEERLHDNLVFLANLFLQAKRFREQTHGNPYRKGTLTKTFRKWLEASDFGKIILNEVERREKERKKI